MKQFRFSLVLAALIIAFTLGACRSRTQPTPEPVPPPPPPVQTAPVVVEPPTDFVPETPAEDAVFSADIQELNRVAQARGWIRDVFFDFDSNVLGSEAQVALQASAVFLNERPELDLLIEGHCDERGTQQYNLALGDRRANTVRDYLVTLGIAPSRVRTISYGEERPFATGSDEQAWRQNRRGHLVLVRR
ncbi:MAG: peptidoglycan-associated lipoprotein Pal, partial [Thermoanaerobaculia bacterium]